MVWLSVPNLRVQSYWLTIQRGRSPHARCPGVDEEIGQSKGCWTRSSRRVDGSTRRQVTFVMKTTSRLTTKRSSVMTMQRRRLKCDVATSVEEDSDAGSSFRWTTTMASVTATATTVMVHDWATLTSVHDWMVARRSVDDARASTGKCQMSISIRCSDVDLTLPSENWTTIDNDEYCRYRATTTTGYSRRRRR